MNWVNLYIHRESIIVVISSMKKGEIHLNVYATSIRKATLSSNWGS